VGEAANPAQASALCAQLKPDVLLLDPNIQRKDGITFIGSLCQEPTKVVVLSFNSGGITAEQVLQVGAAKYFDSGVSVSDMAVAIRQLHPLI
jgi:two-component system, NarL family, nitrate/nitrite response regulator NarL